MQPSDILKTTMIEFMRMSFGLRNAAQTFQRFIDQVLRGFGFVYAYIDGLLINSHSAEEHEVHLRQFLSKSCSMAL